MRIVRVELGGPVVPDPPAHRLELGIPDRKPEHRRSVDHGGVDAIAVHVFEPKLGCGRALPLRTEPGPRERAVGTRGRCTADAEYPIADDPGRDTAAVDDPRPVLTEAPREPGLPNIG